MHFEQLDHVINRSIHANLQTLGGSVGKSQREVGLMDHNVGSNHVSMILGVDQYSASQRNQYIRPNSRSNRSLVTDSSKAHTTLPLPEIVAKERFRYNPVDCNRRYKHTLFREGNLLTSLRRAEEAAGASRTGVAGYLRTNPDASPGWEPGSLDRGKTGKISIKDMTKRMQDSLHQSSYSIQIEEDEVRVDPELAEYKEKLKVAKINFQKEYRQHLCCMNLLSSLRPLQMNWDLNLFKSVLSQGTKPDHQDTYRFPSINQTSTEHMLK